jgi:ABC-2 type transport system permease protein
MLFYMIKLNIKARLQYGRTFVYEAVSHIFAFYLLDFFTIWIILNKFSNIGGWSFFEILFLQTYSYFIRGIAASIFWDSMTSMSDLVREGIIDRYLVAPVNSFYYIVSSKFGAWTLSHIAVGVVGTGVAAAFLGIQWTFTDLIYLTIGFISGVLVYSALIVIGGALAFWIVKSQSFLRILLDSMPLTNYPITIYPKALQVILIFVFPLALINYFPAAHVIGKHSINIFMMLLILGASVMLMIAAYKFWWYGAKKYQGTGS